MNFGEAVKEIKETLDRFMEIAEQVNLNELVTQMSELNSKLEGVDPSHVVGEIEKLNKNAENVDLNTLLVELSSLNDKMSGLDPQDLSNLSRALNEIDPQELQKTMATMNRLAESLEAEE